jgi:DNA-directed RNA polymerase subunit RPC12/RpoP
MALISGPYIKYKCAKCGREIERQISARRAVQDIDELREEKGMVCAECWSGLDLRTA